MKKILALALATITALSCSMVAFASSTTTLTTNVPAATYKLNIPADTVITFNETETNIGSVSVTEATGFADGKNLEVKVSYDAFQCEGRTTTIPYIIEFSSARGGIEVPNNGIITFEGLEDGSVKEFYEKTFTSSPNAQLEKTLVKIESKAWGKALAGEYTSTITFTAEVVAE